MRCGRVVLPLQRPQSGNFLLRFKATAGQACLDSIDAESGLKASTPPAFQRYDHGRSVVQKLRALHPEASAPPAVLFLA